MRVERSQVKAMQFSRLCLSWQENNKTDTNYSTTSRNGMRIEVKTVQKMFQGECGKRMKHPEEKEGKWL